MFVAQDANAIQIETAAFERIDDLSGITRHVGREKNSAGRFIRDKVLHRPQKSAFVQVGNHLDKLVAQRETSSIELAVLIIVDGLQPAALEAAEQLTRPMLRRP